MTTERRPQLGHVLDFAMSTCWAMEPASHRRMMEILARHAQGTKLTADEILAATDTAKPKRRAEMTIDGRTAIIPIHGVIAQRASAVGRISSNVGTSVDHIREDLQAALEDPGVASILLDVDSPGGSVAGIDELGAEIRAARDRKPIIAHTDGLMASAAYWLASQADAIYATTDALVGSIGVIASFYDDHRWLANNGIEPVNIKSTPGKGGVQGNGSISDADRAEVQRQVDHYHAMFVDAVAAGRRIDRDQADAMGNGSVYVGREALDRGYIDKVSTGSAALKAARALARSAAAAMIPEAAGDGAEADSLTENVDMTEKTNGAGAAAAAGASQTTTTTNQAPAAPPAAQADPVAAERQRVAAILEAAAPEQREVANALIADGSPVAVALTRLNADLRNRLGEAQARLAAGGGRTAEDLDAGDELAAGNTDGATAGGELAAANALEDGPEKWAAIYAANPKLRAEFSSAEAYVAFEESVRGRCEPAPAKV